METELGYQILGAAMEVHNTLGPGLLESAYQKALAHELRRRGFDVRREVPLNFEYKGVQLEEAYRADIIVDDKVIIETKAVTEIIPIFTMQVLTYLKLSGLKLAYLINFNSTSLIYNKSFYRLVNRYNQPQ